MSIESQRWLLRGFAQDAVRGLARGWSIFRIATDVRAFTKLGYPEADILKHYWKPVLAAIRDANHAGLQGEE